MKKIAILIMFVACVFATTDKTFAQSEAVQDKLMKHKWVENNKFGNSSPGYTIYNETESLYFREFNKPPQYKGTPYYLSDDINSKIFDHSRVGKVTNGKYMYEQVGKPRTNAEIYEILELNNRKLIIKMVYPDPRLMIGPPSIRHHKSRRL